MDIEQLMTRINSRHETQFRLQGRYAAGENVLVSGERVSGIVDWDAAGCGDRCLDLSKLLFYCYDQPALRDLLSAHIRALSGQTGLALYLSYNILAQLDWSIRHHTPASIDEGVEKSHQILRDLVAQEA